MAVFMIAAGAPQILHATHEPTPEPSNELAARTAAYFAPDRSGEGIFVEILPAGRALVTMFSFAPKFVRGSGPSRQPRQVWMVGLGAYGQGGIYVGDMLMTSGGHFGSGFDVNEIQYHSMGPLFFTFPTCGTSAERGYLEFYPIGPDNLDYDGLELDNYVQLSTVIDCETGQGSAHSYLTGSWYDPSRSGEGFIVEVLTDDRAIVQWMTYDNDGGQMTVNGIGKFDEGGNVLKVDNLQTFEGTYWGSNFKSSEITARNFGSLTIDFWNCDFAEIRYDSPTFGSGRFSLERLTTPLFINDAGTGCWDY